jgi:transcriptional regulator with XRE-family HTH domain
MEKRLPKGSFQAHIFKRLMADRGMPYRRAGFEVECSIHTIGRWANGRNEPNYEQTQRLAAFLGVPVSTLIKS